MLIKVLIFALLLIPTTASFAQVTIGSPNDPSIGAILDLKEQNSTTGGVTSTRGLGLPRVNLSNPNALIPMFESVSGANYVKGSETFNKNTTDQRHVGLVVYNTNKCLSHTGKIEGGMYVWDGDQWQSLSNGIYKNGVYEMQDNRDGETYLAGSFGSAGEWLLENIRYIPADSSIIVSRLSDNLLPAAQRETAKRYFYPQLDAQNGGSGTETNVANISTWNKAQGVLYSYSAATMGAQDAVLVEQGQANTTSTPGPNEVENSPLWPIQGICPSGWHLPSDREWNMLEKEIYNNPLKYSSYTSAELGGNTTFSSTYPAPINASYIGWVSGWETGIVRNNPGGIGSIIQIGGLGARGATPDTLEDPGHGHAMASYCNFFYLVADDEPELIDAIIGRSLSVTEGGFAALQTGKAYAGYANNFGGNGIFWTSSAATDNYNAWFRNIELGSQVERDFLGRSDLYSVRCKKN